MSKQTASLASAPHILGPKPLWGHKGFKLPNYIEAVAQGLLKSGHSESEAIQIAIGVIRHWASGGGKVSAEVRQASAAALAEWEKLKAQVAGDKTGKPTRTSRLRAALTRGK